MRRDAFPALASALSLAAAPALVAAGLLLGPPPFVVGQSLAGARPAAPSSPAVIHPAANLTTDGIPEIPARDEGHGFAKKKNQDFQFYATVAFVKAHLLD